MDTPHKDNECERQLMATIEAEEFTKRNFKTEFTAWRRKIKPLYEMLRMKPEDTDTFSKLVLQEGAEVDLPVEYNNIELLYKCQEVHDQLQGEIQTKKIETCKMWTEIQEIWNEINNNEEIGLCFSIAEAGIRSSLCDLKVQLMKRKEDKNRKLHDFICELRKEISDIWDQCMITEDEKGQFAEFNSYEFTENMLQIHKEELEKWKIYHKKNQEILLKVHKRDTMWKKLRELEVKASDPARFVNRGGSLLKDQNMHNYLLKNLPKLETELINLAKTFEVEHGKKMKILGADISEMIEKEWQIFKEEKIGRKGRTGPSPSKQQNFETIRRSIAPTNSIGQPQIRPLEKRFGSKLELSVAPSAKRSKMQPLKAIQDDNSMNYLK